MDTQTGDIYHDKDLATLSEQIRRRLRPMQTPLTTFQRITRKVGRNEPCPCGSGRKFKNCCWTGWTGNA